MSRSARSHAERRRPPRRFPGPVARVIVVKTSGSADISQRRRVEVPDGQISDQVQMNVWFRCQTSSSDGG